MQQTIQVIKDNDEVIARWISHVVSPHIVGIVVFSLITLNFSDRPLEVLSWVGLLVPLVVIPPFAYLLWQVRRGVVKDIYMPDRETRLRPLTVLMVWFFICLGLIRYWEAPRLVEVLILSITVLVGVLVAGAASTAEAKGRAAGSESELALVGGGEHPARVSPRDATATASARMVDGGLHRSFHRCRGEPTLVAATDQRIHGHHNAGAHRARGPRSLPLGALGAAVAGPARPGERQGIPQACPRDSR